MVKKSDLCSAGTASNGGGSSAFGANDSSLTHSLTSGRTSVGTSNEDDSSVLVSPTRTPNGDEDEMMVFPTSVTTR